MSGASFSSYGMSQQKGEFPILGAGEGQSPEYEPLTPVGGDATQTGGVDGVGGSVASGHTRLYSFRLSCRMVSLTAAKTKRMFSVSVAHVKWE